MKQNTPSLVAEISPDLVIHPLLPEHLQAARNHLDNLTKPQGSLGRLEEIAQRLFAIGAGSTPLCVQPAMMFTVAGDHGVAAQGVSPFPQEVTRQMVSNMLAGGAGINALCRTSGLDFRLVDAGCAGGPFPEHEKLITCRLGDGTADIALGPAMSREQALQGLRNGIMLVRQFAQKGFRCFATGEMGIANTTAATAVYAALLHLDPVTLTGPGAGAGPEMQRHKAQIIRQALQVNREHCAPGMADPVGVLAAVGGFEIATMAGIMLGSASLRCPVLIDGFICSAAYTVAVALCPTLADYAFLSHASAEPGHVTALQQMGSNSPLLSLGMRLGEGTGSAVAYHLLCCAAAIFNDMSTFENARVCGTPCTQ